MGFWCMTRCWDLWFPYLLHVRLTLSVILRPGGVTWTSRGRQGRISLLLRCERNTVLQNKKLRHLQKKKSIRLGGRGKMFCRVKVHFNKTLFFHLQPRSPCSFSSEVVFCWLGRDKHLIVRWGWCTCMECVSITLAGQISPHRAVYQHFYSWLWHQHIIQLPLAGLLAHNTGALLALVVLIAGTQHPVLYMTSEQSPGPVYCILYGGCGWYKAAQIVQERLAESFIH